MPFGDAGGPGLLARFRQAPIGVDALLLNGEHGIDQTRRAREAVGGRDRVRHVVQPWRPPGTGSAIDEGFGSGE